MASVVHVVVMNPLTILVSPTRNLQNFKDQHADQAAKQHPTPLLNSSVYEQLMFKNVCIRKLFCAVFESTLCSLSVGFVWYRQRRFLCLYLH